MKPRNSKMFVGFIHESKKCSLCLVRSSVLFLIFSFVLLSIKEKISSSKSRSKPPSTVLMCFALPSRIECLPPGIMSHCLCRPENEGTSLYQKIYSVALLDFGPRWSTSVSQHPFLFRRVISS